MQAVSALQCATKSRLIALTGMEQESQEEAGERFYESVYLLDIVDSALLLFVRPE